MLFRRTNANQDHLGLTLAIVIPLVTVFIVSGIVFIRRRHQKLRGKSGKKPNPLPLYRAGYDVPGGPKSASSHASDFTLVANKRHDSILMDLKDPFRFPAPTQKPIRVLDLPALPQQAVVLTAHRAYTAPAPQKVNMSERTKEITFEMPHPYSAQKFDHDEKDDPEGWELSYYEENHPPFSRPPSYRRSPTRTRSHSPLSMPTRSVSLRQPKTLSRKTSAATLSRRLSTPLDITISTDVQVHIDSMYVESHAEDLHDNDQMANVDDGKGLRVVSIAPQLPSMYLPSLYLGTPFDTFGELGEAGYGQDMQGGNRRSHIATLESTLDLAQTVTVAPSSPKTPTQEVPTPTSASIKPLDAAIVKESRAIPPGWV